MFFRLQGSNCWSLLFKLLLNKSHPLHNTSSLLVYCRQRVSRNTKFAWWWSLGKNQTVFNSQLCTRILICLVTSLWLWEWRMLSDKLWKISFLPFLLLECRSQEFSIRHCKFSFGICHQYDRPSIIYMQKDEENDWLCELVVYDAFCKKYTVYIISMNYNEIIC